jgi:uncharacterized protein YjbI with pentapeptide repeats
MANLKHMDIIKRGVDSWNTWRSNNSHILPSLSEAGLHMAYLNKADLSKADLSDAGLRLADLIEANLKGADLYWANLSEANLRCANLRCANLQGANMSGSNLHASKMNSANLHQANISRADMRNAELVRANLCGADLSGADLSGAIIKDANLLGTNLTGANLDGADLSDAIVGSTLFGNVDLSNVKGLESLLHLGPSTVGIDTIYKSRGKVPVVFLKNAGVPRHLIDYIEVFVDQNKKHYSCCISFTKNNEDFAHKLFEDLQANGVRCWLAMEKLMRRDRNHVIIESGVKLHDKNIMILSGDSIDSDWAEDEYNVAIEREMKDGKNALVLISLDDSVKYSEKPWVVKMRKSRDLADFSMWMEKEIYQEMFGYLLEELRTGENFSDDIEEFSQEEVYEGSLPVPKEISEIEARNETNEFRAERRQFC